LVPIVGNTYRKSVVRLLARFCAVLHRAKRRKDHYRCDAHPKKPRKTQAILPKKKRSQNIPQAAPPNAITACKPEDKTIGEIILP